MKITYNLFIAIQITLFIAYTYFLGQIVSVGSYGPMGLLPLILFAIAVHGLTLGTSSGVRLASIASVGVMITLLLLAWAGPDYQAQALYGYILPYAVPIIVFPFIAQKVFANLLLADSVTKDHTWNQVKGFMLDVCNARVNYRKRVLDNYLRGNIEVEPAAYEYIFSHHPELLWKHRKSILEQMQKYHTYNTKMSVDILQYMYRFVMLYDGVYTRYASHVRRFVSLTHGSPFYQSIVTEIVKGEILQLYQDPSNHSFLKRFCDITNSYAYPYMLRYYETCAACCETYYPEINKHVLDGDLHLFKIHLLRSGKTGDENDLLSDSLTTLWRNNSGFKYLNDGALNYDGEAISEFSSDISALYHVVPDTVRGVLLKWFNQVALEILFLKSAPKLKTKSLVASFVCKGLHKDLYLAAKEMKLITEARYTHLVKTSFSDDNEKIATMYI